MKPIVKRDRRADVSRESVQQIANLQRGTVAQLNNQVLFRMGDLSSDVGVKKRGSRWLHLRSNRFVPQIEAVAVVGKFADDPRQQYGGWQELHIGVLLGIPSVPKDRCAWTADAIVVFGVNRERGRSPRDQPRYRSSLSQQPITKLKHGSHSLLDSASSRGEILVMYVTVVDMKSADSELWELADRPIEPGGVFAHADTRTPHAIIDVDQYGDRGVRVLLWPQLTR